MLEHENNVSYISLLKLMDSVLSIVKLNKCSQIPKHRNKCMGTIWVVMNTEVTLIALILEWCFGRNSNHVMRRWRRILEARLKGRVGGRSICLFWDPRGSTRNEWPYDWWVQEFLCVQTHWLDTPMQFTNWCCDQECIVWLCKEFVQAFGMVTNIHKA